MTWCPLLLCLWVALLSSTAARPQLLEQLPDNTDVMLSSMGLVEGPDQERELEQAPHAGWQHPDPAATAAAAALFRLTGGISTENDADQDDMQMRSLLRQVLPNTSSLQPQRQRRSSSSSSSSSGGGGSGDTSDAAHQQLTRQLLRRYRELQKRSNPFRRSAFKQPRGYMCLSKVCNFKLARGK